MSDRDREHFINHVFPFLAPGTPFREGVDNVLRARTGGLIIVGFSGDVKKIVDGGFEIEAAYTPAQLYELAKMDGAIILSKNVDTILYANVQLVPDSKILSNETGMRHRTAERVAKSTGELVIAISERRNVITLYQGDHRYTLKDMGVILTKANQAIQTLEKYKAVLDQSITNLGALEFERLVTYQDVSQVLHRVEMALRVKRELVTYVHELGNEGRLITMQLNEILTNVEREAFLLLKDYVKNEETDASKAFHELQNLSEKKPLNDEMILRLLGYTGPLENQDRILSSRGYRLLHRIPRLPSVIIGNIVEYFNTLGAISNASLTDLEKVEGIGETRAKLVKEGLERVQEQMFIDRHI
ncbi:DNA integrity scanning protein DisA [Salicibibacter halophilus]|uniref:DNA integrity scanning protein DisA n=1 Tax=Salicibibacter halophilus TaxID=2502791 RepID=A0A514LI48_9BACI|nr:DNA integrity scanning diadenylate cyclase DisA [Salicibibacter halophilus]QDI91528.1 DNA integrity scanning protein DisA [Salicibibacter halophilus]